MYAVVKTGGKQYRVAKDDKIIVDRLDGEAGDSVVLDQVLMMGDGDKVTLGAPTVPGALVGATVLRQTRGPKLMVFRRKRRKNFRRTQGHRQDLTLIQITDIAADGKLKPANKNAAKPAAPKKEKAPEAETNKAEPKKAPEKKAEAKKAPVKKTAAKKDTAKKTEPKKAAAKPAAKKKTAKKKAK